MAPDLFMATQSHSPLLAVITDQKTGEEVKRNSYIGAYQRWGITISPLFSRDQLSFLILLVKDIERFEDLFTLIFLRSLQIL